MEKLNFTKMVNCPLTNNWTESTICISCPSNKGKTDSFVWCGFRERVGLKDRSTN